MKLQPGTSRGLTTPRLVSVCFAITLFLAVYGAESILSPGAQTPDSPLLTSLLKAGRINIEDDWSGLSSVAPLIAHFTLQRNSDGFVGRANFSAGGYFGSANTTTEGVAIPMDKAETFLRMLSESPLKPGTYRPLIEHTDDYPSIKIEVELENEKVAFFTESQGEGNKPWGATIQGRSYVIESGVPAEALEILKPYLKYGALEKLEKHLSAESSLAEHTDAVVSIEASWELSLASNGLPLYQQMVPNRRPDGSPFAPGGPPMLPAFLELADGAIEPALTLRARNSIPIRKFNVGAGAVVTSDGFILTTRTVAAGWETAYSWDTGYYGAGAVLLRSGFKGRRSEFLNYERLPKAWVPVNSKMVDDSRVKGRKIVGSVKYMIVTIPSATAHYSARLIRVSDRHDLAIIKIDSLERLERVQLEDTQDEVKAGDSLVVRGYPEVAPSNVSRENHEAGSKREAADLITRVGNISRIAFDRDPVFGKEVSGYELDAPPLASGSPVFHEDGRLIALVSMSSRPTATRVFAVPARYAKELMTIQVVK